MLGRMKKDLISLSLTINDLTMSVKSKKTISGDERHKQMKTRETKLQAKFRLDNLMKDIDYEQGERSERIDALKKSIKNKEEALTKRMDRVKRQNEIAESAANENKDQNELEKRQNYLVHKIWSQFYKKKMEREMTRYQKVE